MLNDPEIQYMCLRNKKIHVNGRVYVWVYMQALGNEQGLHCRKDGKNVRGCVQKHKQYGAHIFDQDSRVHISWFHNQSF